MYCHSSAPIPKAIEFAVVCRYNSALGSHVLKGDQNLPRKTAVASLVPYTWSTAGFPPVLHAWSHHVRYYHTKAIKLDWFSMLGRMVDAAT